MAATFELKCVSCKKPISVDDRFAVVFHCPVCGHKIARCGKCRKAGKERVCPNCGFVGP